MELAAGQCWTYDAPAGFETSRIVIGALATCSLGGRIVCFSVSKAPYRWPDGRMETVSIPFVPMSEAAFWRTIRSSIGEGEPDERFADALATWADDPRGLVMFTVPYDGLLDDLIARQMQALDLAA